MDVAYTAITSDQATTYAESLGVFPNYWPVFGTASLAYQETVSSTAPNSSMTTAGVLSCAVAAYAINSTVQVRWWGFGFTSQL